MDKPNANLIKLCDIGWITEIKVDYRQTGCDTADTYVRLKGSNGKVDGLWTTWKQYLDIGVSYNSVAKVKRHMEDTVTEWEKFEKANKKELAEYKRLQIKFGASKT